MTFKLENNLLLFILETYTSLIYDYTVAVCYQSVPCVFVALSVILTVLKMKKLSSFFSV